MKSPHFFFFLKKNENVQNVKMRDFIVPVKTVGARRLSRPWLSVVTLWRATHSLLTEVSAGVLWVLIGTHPCDTSKHGGGGGTRASALTYVSAGGVVVHVVVPGRGGFRV